MAKTVTFYSYKGGVGRTMAMANIAVALAAHGKRVLAVDWDLEAPGLDKFLRVFSSDTPSSSGGLLSLIEGHRGSLPESWRDCVTTVRLSPNHHLSALYSGIGSRSYQSRILDLDWNQFYEKGGGEFLESVREEWDEEFDFVLIDSRTGLTDAGGICTIQMPDILVIVFTATEQSLLGVKEVALRASKGRHKLPYPRLAMPVLPMISRWDGQAEEKEGEEWMERIEKELREFLSFWTPSNTASREVLETLRVPHSPFFSFGEKLPVVQQESLTDDQKPADKYFNVGALLSNHDWNELPSTASEIRKSVEKMRRSVGASRRRRVFLSAVSSEFANESSLLAKALASLDIEVASQEAISSLPLMSIDSLNSRIAECDAVIQLVGADLGACPGPNTTQKALANLPGFKESLEKTGDRIDIETLMQMSYTHWEYLLARYNSVPTYCFVAEYVRDEHTARAADVFGLQKEHLNRILSGNVCSVFRSSEELLVLVQAALKERRPRNLPYSSIGTLFKGREESLEQIRSFSDEVAHAVSPLAICGLGGVGKTRLAIEYAWRFLPEHSATLFVTADSSEAFQRNLASLAGPLVLDLPEAEISDQDIQVAAVIRWLESHSSWLMIIDNVDDDETAREVESLTSRLPSGRTIITSRLSRWPSSISRYELDVLDMDASAVFLLERTEKDRRAQKDDKAVASQIANELDGLPLAIDQAAAYICALGLSFSEYRQRWESRRQQVLSWHDNRTSQLPRSLSVVWETTFDQLTREASFLLEHVAWFSPEPIPVFLFDEPSIEGEWKKLIGDSDVRALLAELHRYSLIRRSDHVDSLSWEIHRLVQEAVRQRTSDDERVTRLQGTLRILEIAFPGDPNDVRTWHRWKELTPHCIAATEFAREAGISNPTAKILSNTAQFLSSRALYSEAEPLMRRALELEEADFGPGHPEIAIKLNNLAALLQEMNRFDEAESLMRRVLEIEEAAYPADHPNVATRLNNLAQLLQATGRLAEAEPLMTRALAIDEASYGPEHPSVATDLNNLAQLMFATDRLEEAETLVRRAIAIDEKLYGPDHPNVAIRLNNLAQLLHTTNRLTEAESLLRRSLAILESAYGAEHPNFSVALNNLGQLLMATNRFEESEPLIRRSLELDEAVYAPDHPRVASGLSNLAQLLTTTNRLAEAEPLLRRSLDIEMQSFGSEHPRVATRLNSYAQLLAALGRHAEAESLSQQAVEILSRFSAEGTDGTNRHLAAAIRNYATVLSEMGSNDKEVAARLNATLNRESFSANAIDTTRNKERKHKRKGRHRRR